MIFYIPLVDVFVFVLLDVVVVVVTVRSHEKIESLVLQLRNVPRFPPYPRMWCSIACQHSAPWQKSH